MTYEIRRATEGDVAFLAAAEREIFPDAWSEHALSAHILSPLSHSLLLLLDGIPMGYLLASAIPPEGELYRIAVLPAYRAGGGGWALLRAYTEDAAAQGCDTLFLEVRASNTPARRLYTRAGYRECGLRKHYYKNPTEDAVLYCLRKDTSC